MGATVTARVPEDVDKDIDFFTMQEHTDRSTLIRNLLVHALEEKKIEFALGKYSKGEITVGRAAEIAGLPLRRMLFLAYQNGVTFQYSEDELSKDFKAA